MDKGKTEALTWVAPGEWGPEAGSGGKDFSYVGFDLE